MGDNRKHALLAPSKAKQWMTCNGSIAMDGEALFQPEVQDEGTVYSREGVQAHTYASWLLEGAKAPPPFMPERELIDFVSVYTHAVRRAAEGKLLFIEQSINIETWTGEKDGSGTADAIIIDNNELEVWDLKYGKGVVVNAENNFQLLLYSLGYLLPAEAVFGKFKTIKLVICQPRRDHFSEWTLTRDELLAFGAKVQVAGAKVMWLVAQVKKDKNFDLTPYLQPTTDGCMFCKHKATCPAFSKMINNVMFEDMTPPKFTGKYITPDEITLVKQWLASKETQVHEDLFAGREAPGWKLVLGRKGNKSWGDRDAEVERRVRDMRILVDDAYDKVLKSPTQMQKGLSKTKWEKLEELVTQADPRPTVAPATDSRPAWKPEEVIFDKL